MHVAQDIVSAIETTQVDHGIRLWWLGGPSLVFKTPETTVYLDPFAGLCLGNPAQFERAIPDIFDPDRVTQADLILSTHDHEDHCNQLTLAPMMAHTLAQLALAPSSYAMVEGWNVFPRELLHRMAPGTQLQLGDVMVIAEPSRDWSDPHAVTFVLQSQGLSLFIGGDTLYFDGLEEIGRRYEVDLAVFALARNNRDLIDQELYMDPATLARAAQAVGTRRLLPVHWDIWAAWTEDPELLRPPLSSSDIELLILQQGESVLLTPDGR